MKNFILLGGFPRSGSTLLCNILAQNHNFYVSKSASGCHDILNNTKNIWGKVLEHRAEGVSTERLQRVLYSILHSYHDTEKQIIIDKCRAWTSSLEMFEFITGYFPKIIIPVRDIRDILASFEKLWRKNNHFSTWQFNEEDKYRSLTTEGRCEIWAEQDQPVGMAYNRIKDIIVRGYKNKVLFVEFENLTRNPELTLKLIYNYLELPSFNHDFNNILQYTQEDDWGVHRIKNLHTIINKVQPIISYSKEILGDNLYNKYSNLEFWR